MAALAYRSEPWCTAICRRRRVLLAAIRRNFLRERYAGLCRPAKPSYQASGAKSFPSSATRQVGRFGNPAAQNTSILRRKRQRTGVRKRKSPRCFRVVISQIRRRREVKTLALVLLLAATPLMAQKSVFCRHCPSTAALDAQFPRSTPKPQKPERAKEQRQAKSHHGKGKNQTKGTPPPAPGR